MIVEIFLVTRNRGIRGLYTRYTVVSTMNKLDGNCFERSLLIYIYMYVRIQVIKKFVCIIKQWNYYRLINPRMPFTPIVPDPLTDLSINYSIATSALYTPHPSDKSLPRRVIILCNLICILSRELSTTVSHASLTRVYIRFFQFLSEQIRKCSFCHITCDYNEPIIEQIIDYEEIS